MVHIVEYKVLEESGEFIHKCPACGYMDSEPFEEILPYKHEVKQCPQCKSILINQGITV